MGRKPGSKNKVKPIPTSYDLCGDAITDLANELISKYHSHLATAKVAYVYVNKEMKRNGQLTIATAQKITPKIKAICDYDFLITISYPSWNDLTDRQKRAVLDHELTHCWVEETEDGEPVYKLLKHNFSDFTEVLERNGLYMDDLVILGRVIKNVNDDQ